MLARRTGATAFAVAGKGFTSLYVLPELIFLVGSTPLVSISTPGTMAVCGRIEHLEGHNALLLAHHGAVTVDRTPEEAGIRMEALRARASAAGVE